MIDEPSVAVATRTLRASGFIITHVARHPSHIEYHCEREDAFGADVGYVVAISVGEQPSEDTRNVAEEAARPARTCVLVAKGRGPNWLSWEEFLGALGGPVPSWRALDANYAEALKTASRNELPAGSTGEAWRVFEEAVADGLEFIFGRRVRRMGSAKRFKPLPDMLALTPDDLLLIVDAKASDQGI